MTIRLVTDEKVAETSLKGKQEKWYDRAGQLLQHYLHPADEHRPQPIRAAVSHGEDDGKSCLGSPSAAFGILPQRDWGVITGRVEACIFTRQKSCRTEERICTNCARF